MGLISRVSSRTYRNFYIDFFIYKKMDNDTGRSFHSQGQITLNRNKLNTKVIKSKSGTGKPRKVKSVGLGIKTPKDAKTLDYVDKKCPFTGNVSIRGRILTGVVTKLKMNRTCAIRRDYLHYIKKYNRFEKRHKTVSVHCSPAFRLKVGDVVTVGQCRPISKTVRFNVLRKEVQRVEGNVKKD